MMGPFWVDWLASVPWKLHQESHPEGWPHYFCEPKKGWRMAFGTCLYWWSCAHDGHSTHREQLLETLRSKPESHQGVLAQKPFQAAGILQADHELVFDLNAEPAAQNAQLVMHSGFTMIRGKLFCLLKQFDQRAELIHSDDLWPQILPQFHHPRILEIQMQYSSPMDPWSKTQFFPLQFLSPCCHGLKGPLEFYI